eukprot:c24036_g1_i1 orf=395-9547(-)
MPKRVTSSKPSAKPSRRRGQSYSAVAGNCNAIHLSIPFPNSSSALSVSSSVSASSTSENTHTLSSLECSTRLSPPVSSLTSSVSSPSPCSFASLSVTCLEMETPEGSCSASYRQVPQHDVLYEYIKGLQEANKALDVDVAERVMQELADSMTSPAAAAMVVSSGGAHLIASAVKQFKAHGLQKATTSRGKGLKAGSKPSPASKALNADTRVEVGEPLQIKPQSVSPSTMSEPLHQQSSDTNELLTVKEVMLDDGQPPQAVPTCNEARRKRQRTSDELLEFEEYKGECQCKCNPEIYTISSFAGESRTGTTSPTDATGWNLSNGASEFPSLCPRVPRDVNDCTGPSKSEALCSKWVELVKNKMNRPKQEEDKCLEVIDREIRHEKVEPVFHSGSSQVDADDVLISMSKKFGDVSRTLLEAMVDEVCESRSSSCRNAELEATIMNRLQGMVTASVQSLPVGSTAQCKVLLTKQRDLVSNAKQSAKAWCATVREKNKGKPLHLLSKGDVTEMKQKISSVPLERNDLSKYPGDQLRNTERAHDTFQQTEHQSSGSTKQHRDSCRTNKGCHGKEGSMNGLDCSLCCKKGVTCEEEGKPLDDLSTRKTTGEISSADEAKVALPSVLNLAREAGLPDIVATACHALDRLINAALQGKGAPVGNNAVTVSYPPGRRRGKVLPPELYVALTEALVEIVQVLKDQVELLCWCLDCLGSILPPTSLNRSPYDGFSNSACSALDTFFSSKDLLHANGCKGKKADGGASGKQGMCEQIDMPSNAQSSKSSSAASKVEMPSKSVPKSFSGALNSEATHSACDSACLSSSKSAMGLGPSLCSSMSSGSATSSISALAAVAYTATVPMLAEKAVKAILSAIQPCDIEPQSTQAALHALSAHLSSTNSKYVCDDVIAFIIAAMREFKSDAEMQTESCITLSSLNRAISSATGHCAWSTIMDTMNTHHTNIVVQRAGCSALHVLCTRAGLGVLEWGSGKRPERAGKDSDREAGVEALVSAMLSFPDDVRIQWHGCSALWTLVHSAGTRSVANMVCSGALCAVIGAMRVCRTNEVMQQEGCNVIGTMTRMLVESGFGFGSQLTSDGPESSTVQKCTDRYGDDNRSLNRKMVHSASKPKERFLDLSEVWWEALKVVVAAMRAFKKSKSVQSNGIFALGCILKGSMESIHMTLAASSVPSVPDKSIGSSDLFMAHSKASTCGSDTIGGDEGQKGLLSLSRASSSLCLEQLGHEHAETLDCLGRGALEDIGWLNEAVEVTMVAMPEFPKAETIQVWGCAVLQQVFLAYVHYSKRVMPLLPTGSAKSGSSSGGNSRKNLIQATFGTEGLSQPSALANLVLSQATATMFMISGMMALSYNGPAASADQQGLDKSSPCCDSKVSTKPATSKPTVLRSQNSQTNQSLTSVRQSWCAALGAIGDVFGHLTQSTENSVGKSLPKMAHEFHITATVSSTDSSKVESPVSKGKDAELTAKVTDQRKSLEDGHLDSKVGGLPAEFSTSYKQLSSSHVAKRIPFIPGTNRVVRFSSCRPVRTSEDTSSKSKPEKKVSNSCIKSDASELVLSKAEWGGKDGFSQQQVINDIEAWQEATESLAKIAERVGFPMSVKNAILAIRTILYKLEDAETVIWACHALVSLYLTWENVHLFKSGLEDNREEYKAKIWGEGDVGVRQLVYLVSHWTKQNRTDVMSLALQALYSTCVFAATVREIEEVFTPSDCGIEVVLGVMQKVLGSGGSLSQRRKVVQQACCVLTEVCNYSIPVQIGFAAAGGADIILSALDRFDEDNEVLVNGLHALGLDSRSQSDFDVLWNAAIYKSNLSNGGRGSRKKKGGSTSIVGLSHVFKEGAAISSNVAPSSIDGKGVAEEASFDSEHFGIKFSPQFERLVFDGTSQMGRFLTWLIAGPGCGGPAFCVEILRRLNSMPQKQSDMQSHVCIVIGHMSTNNSKWCQDFLDSGGFEAVLACIEGFQFSGDEKVPSLPICMNGVEKTLYFDLPEDEVKSAPGKLKMPRRKQNQKGKCSESGVAGSLNDHAQYAACIALSGLFRDQETSNPLTINAIIKALVLTLHHYGGLSHLDLHISRVESVQLEVCATVRLALARLGVSWIGDSKSKHLAHEAAEVGDLTSLEALGQKGIDIMAMDGSGHTSLWYAEQSGQAKVAQYLKDQEQLCERRRAREMSRVKGRRGLSKGDLQPVNEQDENEELQLSQSFQGRLDVPQPAEVQNFKKELQVMKSRNSPQSRLSTAEQAAKETSKIVCSKGSLMPGADYSTPATVRKEPEACSASKNKNATLSTCPLTQDTAVLEIERKKSAHRKRNKGGKKSKANQQNFGENFAGSLDIVGEESGDEIICPVVKHAAVVKNGHNCNLATLKLISGDVKGSKGNETVSNDSTHCLNLLVVPSASTDKKNTHCTPFVSSTGTCEKNDKSDRANQLLHEALVSGVVENLEVALQSCEDPESGADEALLKKVRAALAKRVKRMEKSAALEKELSAAVEEGSCSRVHAAILAIENVPRFAAAFSEKLIAAKSLLLEIQSKEKPIGKEDVRKRIGSGLAVTAGTLPSFHLKDDVYAHDDSELFKECVKLTGKKDGEGVLGLRREFSGPQVLAEAHQLTKSDTGKQSISTVRADTDSSSLETTLSDCNFLRSGCRRERGGRGNSKGLSQTLSLPKSQAFSMYPGQDYGKVSHNVVLCSAGSSEPLGSVPLLKEKPPLLPTPQAFDFSASPIDHLARLVIQPPRHRDQPLGSLEHNPITPQLFPVSQGAPFGYSYREVLRGKHDILSDGCSLSNRDVISRESELAPLHISQLFPPCSSPQLFSANSDSVCFNSWPTDYSSEQGAAVQNFATSCVSAQSTDLPRDFVPSSTTLFSSSLGERHQFSRGTAFTSGSSYDSLPLPSAHMHSLSYARASESNVGSLPTFVQQALSCTCDDDFSEEHQGSVNKSSWMPSAACSAGEVQEHLMDYKLHHIKSLPAEAACKENTRWLSSVNQDFHHLSQVHLQQAALLDASMGVSCCVCFDRPKDATLISCGHQMCKMCAEEMHRLHRLCPVCNRMIETVLALCT